MTLDDIADLAEKAGCDVSALDGREFQSMWCDSDQLQKLSALIEAETIERCAAVCEERMHYYNRGAAEAYESENCAAAIRSLK